MSTSESVATLVELPSGYSFEGTLQRLLDAIQAKGLTLFSQIDHAALAAAAGLVMPPTTVLLYGNPKGGTPVMVAVPTAALDLPLRLLVREDGTGRTHVAFHPVVAMLQGVGAPREMAEHLLPAQAWIAEALAAMGNADEQR
jgi:uncharacterized protein (DUF302 family)